MSSRKLRRQAEHQARKAARKAGFPNITTQSAAAAAATVTPEILAAAIDQVIPDLRLSSPSVTATVSPARAAASRENGAKSQGPLTPETKSVSSQNHTTHGLARHQNGTFKLLTCESSAGFEALKQSLLDEHQPVTPTESILVNSLIEAHWLAERAQRLQATCLHPDTGVITDEKKFNLYMRYQTTHTRAFHKCLDQLAKLRKEKRQAHLGFEAQTIANQRHEMKKVAFEWDIARKDALACQQLNILTTLRVEACKQNPNFMAEYEAELAKRGFQVDALGAATRAA